jgi:hypothetical protein
MERKYLPRIADKALDLALKSSGAVLIEGPKACGKTWTAKQKAKSVLFLQDPDKRANYLKIADTKPSLLLTGNTPRLIDEWADAPVLWDAVRFTVDERGLSGQFILTGSAVPLDNATAHTGTGRISRFMMRPMSLFESNESNGSVSLQELFDGKKDIDGMTDLTIEKLAFVLCRGGFPQSIGEESDQIALQKVYNYLDAVINIDVSRVDGIEKNPSRVRAVMRSLARNISTTAPLTTIVADIANDAEATSDKTVSSYINALRRLMVVEDLPAWNPAVRSRTAIRTSPKRHFVDPSIATAALRVTPEGLLSDFNTFGLLFESLAIRDLRVYAQAIDGELFHYQDKDKLEADAVIHLKDGRWAAVEVKMGTKEIEEAAKNLLALGKKINTEKMHAPSFLMILTATDIAYRRPDGVYIVPIGCLKD